MPLIPLSFTVQEWGLILSVLILLIGPGIIIRVAPRMRNLLRGQIALPMISHPKGCLNYVPPRPPNFVPRSQDLADVKLALLSPDDRSMAITGLQGMGGIGKSVLASEIARNDQVRKAFPDGVIWITLGQKPDLLNSQLQLIKSLGASQATITGVEDGKGRLSQLLKDKFCLIILDDVWKMEHLNAFYALGSNCRMLITTRILSIVRDLKAREYSLDVLNEEKSLELLFLWSGQEALTPEAKEVAEECGNLPLALAMVGAMAKDKPDRWGNILYRLKSADLEKITAEFPDYPYPNLMRAIEVSMEDLESDQRRSYLELELAAFPEDAIVPVKTLQVLWDMNEYDAQDFIDLLADRSLARLGGSTFSLHDLQHDYVVKRAGDLKALHNRFLDAYEKRCPKGWASGPNDGYFFQHLAYHLSQAGRIEDLNRLLLDFNWIRAKLQAVDLISLISDYDYMPDQDELRLIQGAIRLSAHVLSHDPMQLQSQLYGRLMGHRSQRIQALMEQILEVSSDPWLRPLTPSLIASGGPLIRTFQGHTNSVDAVTVTTDGRKAISGSQDNTLKVWDLETSEELRTLKGHTNWVSAVAVTSDGRKAVSGSDDKTLKVWDLETGEELRTLKGHTYWVSAVAVTPDGRKAISGSWDHTLKVWDLETGDVIATFAGEGPIIATAIGSNGLNIIAGESSGRVHFLKLEGI